MNSSALVASLRYRRSTGKVVLDETTAVLLYFVIPMTASESEKLRPDLVSCGLSDR
jgi:hypothetical protein